ncbi:MAG: hypothetical protein A2Z02_03535 [Chloroflexi bacterium RBG_16_48_7]|nr:MAG: hypothetical protein A2Z02_03535 [Chloroflexi bacterium RBG_16_48_7]
MKKILVPGLLLLLILVFTLPACGSAAPATTAAPTQTAAPTTQPPQVIKLKYSTSMAPVEGPTKVATRMLDTIEQKSAGKIKVDRFVGGTLGKANEQLGLVGGGSVDFVSYSMTWAKDQLPLHSYMNWGTGSQAKVLDLMNKLNFEIPETKAILDEECKAKGIKILFFLCVGQNGIIGKPQFTKLADLKGKKIGVVPAYRALDALGLTTVSMNIPDIYEGLAKGVIDAEALALQPMYLLKWHEVSKCFMADGHYSAGQLICVNLKTWDSLSPDLQKIVQDAAADAQKWGCNLVVEDEGKALQAFKDAGLTTGTLPASDTEQMFALEYKFRAKDMIDLCTPIGKVDQAKIILKNLDQITGVKSQ